jgi:Zn-dependent M28 family amino/carboxypeptidase
VELVYILDSKVKVLKNKEIKLVNVQWTCYDLEYDTWEHKEAMLEEYSRFFENFEES